MITLHEDSSYNDEKSMFQNSAGILTCPCSRISVNSKKAQKAAKNMNPKKNLERTSKVLIIKVGK